MPAQQDSPFRFMGTNACYHLNQTAATCRDCHDSKDLVVAEHECPQVDSIGSLSQVSSPQVSIFSII